jgi:hypothetical protein
MLSSKLIKNGIIYLLVIVSLGCTVSNPPQINPQETSAPNTETPSTQLPAASETAALSSDPLPTPELTDEALPPAEESSSIAYDIKVNFDFSAQKANVLQTTRYRNPSDFPISEFLLACDPLRTDGVFALESVKINGLSREAEIGDYWIKILSDAPIEKGQEALIELVYSLTLPQIPEPADDRKPVIFGYTPLQSNFVDWYPLIVPQDQAGQWILHDPWFYGEYLVYPLADFTISLNIANAPQGLVVAASTIPSTSGENIYTYKIEHARNFVWTASPSYQFSQATINGITVSSYYFPFHKNAGEQVLTETVNAIRLYSELFTDYPRKNLTVVEADFLDGMEYDGFYFLSKGFYNLFDGTPKGYLTTIAVHETAHQWWYSLVANDQALEPWLDEAFCTYSEYLYYENIYPDLKDWWWAYRVNFYTPQGKIDAAIYDYQGFIPYRNATYLRGAKFLQELRTQIGDEKFFAFLQAYTAANRDKISTAQSFWEVLSQISPGSFSELKSDYFK